MIMSKRADKYSKLVQIRLAATESQAAQLQKTLSDQAPTADYQEEQHGSRLVVKIRCEASEEHRIHGLINQVGIDSSSNLDDEA
jgi:hypothetical protein